MQLIHPFFFISPPSLSSFYVFAFTFLVSSEISSLLHFSSLSFVFLSFFLSFFFNFQKHFGLVLNIVFKDDFFWTFPFSIIKP